MDLCRLEGGEIETSTRRIAVHLSGVDVIDLVTVDLLARAVTAQQHKEPRRKSSCNSVPGHGICFILEHANTLIAACSLSGEALTDVQYDGRTWIGLFFGRTCNTFQALLCNGHTSEKRVTEDSCFWNGSNVLDGLGSEE